MEWVTERYKLVYNAETKRAVSRWGIWTEKEKENERKRKEAAGEDYPQSWKGVRRREGEEGGKELHIMDWFSHFFEGLFFLSPSRWMVIAPPALIMCWIGGKKKTKKKKKKGGKCFYGDWESITLGVDLLLLRFIPHHTSTHRDANTQTYFELLAL